VRAPRDLAASLKPSTIASYVAREFAFSFLIAFLFFFVVFFVNQLLLMAEDILSRRAPLRDVLLLLFYSMPSEIAMAFPFASLVGALMAAGRFASDNEMLVFQACGIPARRIFLPFAILGLAFSLVSFIMNDYYLPLGNIEFGKVYRKLIVSTPAVELRPWSVRRYRDVTIVTGAEEKGIIKDILIFDTSEEGRERLISAKRAGISEGADSDDVVALKLDGVLVQILVAKEPDRFEYSSCASMTYSIDLRDAAGIVSSIGPSSMSSVDLSREIGEKQKAFDARRQKREEELAVARAKLEETYEGAELGELAWPNAQSRITPPFRTCARSSEAPSRTEASKPTGSSTTRNSPFPSAPFFSSFSLSPGTQGPPRGTVGRLWPRTSRRRRVLGPPSRGTDLRDEAGLVALLVDVGPQRLRPRGGNSLLARGQTSVVGRKD